MNRNFLVAPLFVFLMCAMQSHKGEAAQEQTLAQKIALEIEDMPDLQEGFALVGEKSLQQFIHDDLAQHPVEDSQEWNVKSQAYWGMHERAMNAVRKKLHYELYRILNNICAAGSSIEKQEMITGSSIEKQEMINRQDRRILEYATNYPWSACNLLDDEKAAALLLIKIAEQGNDSVAAYILENCQIPIIEGIHSRNHDTGMLPLNYAASCNAKFVWKLLQEAGVNINKQDEAGSTALLYAAFHHDIKAIQFLLEHGADCNIRNNAAMRPLDKAFWRTKYSPAFKDTLSQVVKLFFEYGMDAKLVDNNGDNFLHLASSNGVSSIIPQLVTWNVDVNQGNCKGETPLHYAAKDNDDKAVELLLASGAYTHLEDNAGKTAYAYAAENSTRAGEKKIYKECARRIMDILARGTAERATTA